MLEIAGGIILAVLFLSAWNDFVDLLSEPLFWKIIFFPIWFPFWLLEKILNAGRRPKSQLNNANNFHKNTFEKNSKLNLPTKRFWFAELKPQKMFLVWAYIVVIALALIMVSKIIW